MSLYRIHVTFRLTQWTEVDEYEWVRCPSIVVLVAVAVGHVTRVVGGQGLHKFFRRHILHDEQNYQGLLQDFTQEGQLLSGKLQRWANTKPRGNREIQLPEVGGGGKSIPRKKFSLVAIDTYVY